MALDLGSYELDTTGLESNSPAAASFNPNLFLSQGAQKPSFLTSAWNKVEAYFGVAGKTTAHLDPNMTPGQKAAATTSATISNAGALMAIFGAANQAVGAFYAAKSKQYEERSAASSYAFQSDMAAINSRQAEYAAQSTLEAGKSQVQQYTMAAGQEAASTTAEMAAHGVALGEGSARDVSASQDLIKKMDVLTINSNATKTAWAQRMQATSFQNQSLLDRVSAQNALAGAKTISPMAGVATSLIGNATQFASQWDYRRKLQLQIGGKDPYYQYPGAATQIGTP